MTNLAPAPWHNPDARRARLVPAPGGVDRFHRGLAGYAPTPLVDLPGIAAQLGVARVFAKDESARLGLPAFKVLGVSWAVARMLGERLGVPDEDLSLPALRAALTGQPPVTLVTATDGNHGRALARVAATLGLAARVVVPAGLPAATVAAIRAEGAAVTALDDDYDAAVAHAAALASAEPAMALVQDTAWPGYERVPGWVVEGYATLFREIDAQLAPDGLSAGPVAVPTGVGSLLQAAVTHYRRAPDGTGTAVLAVEPDTAACVLASLHRGELTSVPTGQTVMNGLNCGTPSSLAWPAVRDGLNLAVAVDDDAARRAVGDLAAAGIAAGPSGAAALAGARALLADRSKRVTALHGDAASLTVVLLCTEGIAATT